MFFPAGDLPFGPPQSPSSPRPRHRPWPSLFCWSGGWSSGWSGERCGGALLSAGREWWREGGRVALEVSRNQATSLRLWSLFWMHADPSTASSNENTLIFKKRPTYRFFCFCLVGVGRWGFVLCLESLFIWFEPAKSWGSPWSSM